MNSKLTMTMAFAAAIAITATSVAAAETDTFDQAQPGSPPSDWTCGVTGRGAPKWLIEADASAPSKPNVLKQSGSGAFPWCVKKDVAIADGFVEVKFKPVAGKEDQAGGVVWRAKDANNYYLARANALEGSVTIYRTIGGRRVPFQNTETKVAPGLWHTLRVDFKGSEFTVTFDGKKVIEASDESFKDAGKVGVWTKADSVTLFDDFRSGET